jgi:hypothetical protein
MKTAPGDKLITTGAGLELFRSLQTTRGCDVLDRTGWQLYTSLSGCQAVLLTTAPRQITAQTGPSGCDIRAMILSINPENDLIPCLIREG